MGPIKTFLFNVYRSYYLATALLRSKPDFLIIGVQKGGTTSLFYYLKQHPQIKLPRNKEIHFFDRYFAKGMLWYKSWFPLRLFKKNFLTGEATPSYIWDKDTAERIKNMLPGIKIIILLRDPVDRAYSHYHMEVKKKRETHVSFEGAIHQEVEFLQQGRSDYENAPTSYLIRGLYVPQLQKYYQLFDPQQILVLRSEDLKSKPEVILNQLLNFLELPGWNNWKITEKNITQYGSPLAQETRAKLDQLFLEKNKDLELIVKQKPSR